MNSISRIVGTSSRGLPGSGRCRRLHRSDVHLLLTRRRLHGTGIFDVRTYGAVGDGKTVDTPAINKAIDAAAAAGGARWFSPREHG